MKIDQSEQQHRELLTKAKRVVVKIGTNVLVDNKGQPCQHRIALIVKQLASLRKLQKEIIIVSSGAIGAGLHVLGLKKRPTALADLQTAAAIGQLQLLNYYHHCFTKSHCKISQVLLTHADLKDRKRHLNARNTLLSILRYGVIPIINENDVVADDEIKIGDNDVLSALVTILVDADLLILLTTPEGLMAPRDDGKLKCISYLPSINRNTFNLVTQKQNQFSTGGMGSKLRAAHTAAKSGAMVVIASGFRRNVIKNVLHGKNVGTLIGNEDIRLKISKRKQWLSYFHRAKGKIYLNPCATDALQLHGASLLPIGIEKVEGIFGIGDYINIVNASGEVIGYGLTEYSSVDIDKIKSKHSSEIIEILGYKNNNAVIHRDNLVLVAKDSI